jgi:hypothetical protein
VASIEGGGAVPECFLVAEGTDWWFPQGVTLGDAWSESVEDCSTLAPCD